MHVLVIAQLFPPDIGGGSTRAYNVVKGLISLGHKVTVITAFPHYPTGKIPKKYRHRLMSIENFRKVKIVRTWVPPLASRGLAKRFVLYISFVVSSLFAFPLTGHVDVVWAANPNILSVYPSLVYRLFKKCQVVQNMDDLWPEELYKFGMLRSRTLRKVADFVSGLAYMTSGAITPISPAYVDVIVSRYKVDPEKVHVVPAGVDIDNFKAFSSTKQTNEGDTFNVLYIGSLALAYDFDCVLKAANLLSSESRIKFVIQGEGELGDYLRFKVKEMNLQNADIILKVVSRAEVAEILSSADVLLLPLRNVNYAGISSKLYEYQASGRPIICCSKGQPAHYTLQTGSGIVVNPGNPNDLAKAILFLFHNEELREKLGKAGRQYVEDNLSCEKIGLQMEGVFKSSANYRKSLMSMKDEIDVYDKAKVTIDTGEIEEFDKIIFPNVIRRREIDLIKSELQAVKPKRILDFGCGGGWLSRVLASYECEVVGIDVNHSLINSARRAAPMANFIVGNCMNMPFREKSFDAIVGIAILHHLNIYSALSECYRVTVGGSLLLFMEPNKLDPISALGRKILPMKTHTKGEQPLTLQELSEPFAKAKLIIKEIKQIFPYSFGLARLFRRRNIPKIIVPFVDMSEKLLEEIPIIKSLSSTFFIAAIRN